MLRKKRFCISRGSTKNELGWREVLRIINDVLKRLDSDPCLCRCSCTSGRCLWPTFRGQPFLSGPARGTKNEFLKDTMAACDFMEVNCYCTKVKTTTEEQVRLFPFFVVFPIGTSWEKQHSGLTLLPDASATQTFSTLAKHWSIWHYLMPFHASGITRGTTTWTYWSRNSHTAAISGSQYFGGRDDNSRTESP